MMAREVVGHTKPPVAGIKKSPRVGRSERGAAGQSKERTAGPSTVPGIEGDNPEVHKPVSCGYITVVRIYDIF